MPIRLFSLAPLVLLCAPPHADAQAAYKPGAKVADFALKDDNGKTVRLSDSRGRVRLLVFYASWCGPCNEEAPSLEKDVWQAYKNKGVQVLGLAIMEQVPDPAVKLRAFRARHHVTYPLLSDENMQAFNKFGGGGIPCCVLLDRQGRFVARYDTLNVAKKRLPALLAAKR